MTMILKMILMIRKNRNNSYEFANYLPEKDMIVVLITDTLDVETIEVTTYIIAIMHKLQVY